MRTLGIALVVVAVAMAPAVARAAPGDGEPGDGIANTAHDFSGKDVTGGNGETFTTGMCTFCHTPHKAISTLLLWNHTLSTNNFAWDEPATTGGTTFATFKGDTYKGPTAKCLSCHDGSVAIGDVAWFGEGKPAAPLDTDMHSGADDPFRVGFGGNMSGNHPVAMPYPYLNAKNTYNGVTTGDQVALGEWQSTPLANIRVFTDTTGAGDIVGGVATAGKTGIECSSCHDPHNVQAVDDLFLRGRISGNDTTYICLKCHAK